MKTRRRLLLMYITNVTGHYHASKALEEAVRYLDPSVETLCIDASYYTSRFVRWAVYRAYLSLIRHQPDVWEYLYDNPTVHRQLKYLRSLLYRYQARRLEQLITSFQPDAIACTQAYPCGMVADFKKRRCLSIPLLGILTDHAPHLYWFHEAVDMYVVPSEQAKQRFVTGGIDRDRVSVLGIPIEMRFSQSSDTAAIADRLHLNPERPILLIMGGHSGLGPVREIVRSLDTLPHPCQLVVLTGTNRGLYNWFRGRRFRHRVVGLEYTNEVPALMGLASLIIGKPGGLTISEALSRDLPFVIVSPIPGQEAYNARYLLSHGAGVAAWVPQMVRQTVRDLLDNPDRLASLRRSVVRLGRPHASFDIARLIFQLWERRQVARSMTGSRAQGFAQSSRGIESGN